VYCLLVPELASKFEVLGETIPEMGEGDKGEK
jgi:hypothetical protein